MAKVSEFALPGSGYDVIKKILHAYVLCGSDEVPLSEVSQKAGMHNTIVSRNNGFLASVGVIEGGRKKKLTDRGGKLALAISHEDDEATGAAWRTVIAESPHLQGVIDMIKVQGSIARDVLPGKIGSHFGFPGGKGRTGLNAIVEILLDAGAVGMKDDKCVVKEGVRTHQPTSQGNAKPEGGGAVGISPPPQVGVGGAVGGPVVPIHINIELHLPATAEEDVYNAIFKSIRQNLMERGDGVSDES